MYYAITVRDGLITARHESRTPITGETFTESTRFAGQEVLPVGPETEYAGGYRVAEYDAAGLLRPLVDRIRDGLREVPAGFELIDGSLVPVAVPEAEVPPTLAQRLELLQAGVENIRSSLISRLTIYEGMTAWSEIKVGALVPAGQVVISVFKKYRAKREHTKGLLAPALDTANWEIWDG